MTLSPDGKRLIVAAEQGDFIAQFIIAEKYGNLAPAGHALPSASPCTIAFFLR